MTIPATCPSCGKAYNLPAPMAGKQVRCQRCRATFAIQAPAAVEDDYPVADFADDEEPKRPPRKSHAWVYVLVGSGVAAFLVFGVVVVGCAGLVFSLKVTTGASFASNPAPAPFPGPPPTRPTEPRPTPPTEPRPMPPIDTQPKPKPPPDPKPEPPVEESVGPKVDADPLPEPVQAPVNPSGVLPLPSAADDRNNPVRYPWGPGPIVAVASSKEGKGVWQVWNLQTMKQLGSIPGMSGADLKLSNDGTVAALPVYAQPSSVHPSGLQVYTVADGQTLPKLKAGGGGDSRIGVTEFAGSGHFLSLHSAGRDRTATVWDVKTGEKVASYKTAGLVGKPWTTLSPGGRYLAVFDGWKHSINVYEVTTGKVVRTIQPTLPKSSFYSCEGLAFSYDGKELAALLWGDFGNIVRAWDFETGERTADHKISPRLAETAKNPPPGFLAPFEWLPDRSGWFAYSQLMIDRDSGRIVWNYPLKNPSIEGFWIRRFVDANHIATVVMKSGGRQLQIIPLPKDEIDAARRK